MIAFNGYPISVLVALLLHGLILAGILYMERASSQQVTELVRPPAVRALLVEENPQVCNERVQQQQQQQQEAARQRQQEEQRRAEQQRQEAERQAQLRREEEQREAEQRRQQDLQRQREEEQRRQEEQQRQEEERRRQQEQQRQEEQRRLDEQRQQQEAADRAASDARQQAETEAEIIGAYTAIIHDLVQRNWSRPPSARNNMEAVLRIRLVPTGEVVDVEIVRSSGDAAFDRSAESAVRAVGRFTELQGMPPRLFERSFRSLLLTFRPEDLRN
jgi:colicin import membrane protein